MLIESTILCRNQAPIKAIRRDAGFARADQHDGVPTRVEGIGDAPLAISHAKAELLHVPMPRPLQRIGMRPTERWSQRLENHKLSGRSPLDVVAPFLELRCKRIVESDRPSDTTI